MRPDEKRLLEMLFHDTGGEFFEVIDGAIRKPAIKTYLADVSSPTKEHGFDEEIWTVQINWRLLNKWMKGGGE